MQYKLSKVTDIEHEKRCKEKKKDIYILWNVIRQSVYLIIKYILYSNFLFCHLLKSCYIRRFLSIDEYKLPAKEEKLRSIKSHF